MRRLLMLVGLLAVWPLPLAAQALAEKCENLKPELVLQTGHTSLVQAVAFSPDGHLLATGGAEHAIKLWDVATGVELRSLIGHTYWILGLAFSPDGRWLASASGDFTVKIWDVTTGRLERTLGGHKAAVTSVRFSPDGLRLVTGSDDETIKIWNVSTWQVEHTLGSPRGKVRRAAFTPDGHHLVAISGPLLSNNVTVWNATSWQEERTFVTHETMKYGFASGVLVSDMALSPDSLLVATAGWDGTARVWELATGRQVAKLPSQSEKVDAVAFSPEGRLLAVAGEDKVVTLWRTDTWQQASTLPGAADAIWAVAFSSNGGLIAAGCKDHTTKVWDAATARLAHTLAGQTKIVQSVAFTPDGHWVLTAEGSHAAKFWDTATGRVARVIRGQPDQVRNAVLSKDGRLVAAGSLDGKVTVWEAATGRQLATLTGFIRFLSFVAFSPDATRVAAGGQGDVVKVWSLPDGQELLTIHVPSSQPRAAFLGGVAFSPDGKFLATAWETVTTVVNEHMATLWDATTGKEVRTLAKHDGRLGGVAFSPNGQLVATAGWDNLVKLSDVATGTTVQVLRVPPRQFVQRYLNVAFSPDGRWVAAGNQEHTVVLWEAETGKVVREFVGHSGFVLGVGFSPDGRWLISGSTDGSTRLWNTEDGKELAKLVSIGEQDWAVVDSEGRFDASAGGMEMMHWVVRQEIIALAQLKERYYDPGLLAKILGRDKEPLSDVGGFDRVALYPEVKFAGPVGPDGKLRLELKDRCGGIGRVQVFVNGKEYVVLEPKEAAARSQTGPLTVDLSGAPTLAPGEPNQVRVVVWNQEGYLWGSGEPIEWTPRGTPDRRPPELYAILAGISHYASTDPNVQLTFPMKDAMKMARAIEIAGKRFFGLEHLHITLLTSPAQPGAPLPTKQNIRRAFEEVRKMRPKDLLIIYFAGHGVTVHGMYAYPTQEATNLNFSDEARRAKEAITDKELVDWIEEVPARHQVLILDTCAAGAAEAQLSRVRDIPGDQVKAAERYKDRTGSYVLMGSAADAVSYETSKYDEGLLTYALLQGMRGAALREDKYVDVSKLFQYAADMVPELAYDIGGIQKPRIAMPRGGASFDIGELLREDREAIPLAEPKPMILRATFQSQDRIFDYLQLTPAFKQRMREATFAVPRGGKWVEAPAVFVDADDMPGAILPIGRYTVQSGKVSVQLTLVRDQKELDTLQVEGTADDIPGLAAKLVDALFRAAQAKK